MISQIESMQGPGIWWALFQTVNEKKKILDNCDDNPDTTGKAVFTGGIIYKLGEESGFVYWNGSITTGLL